MANIKNGPDKESINIGLSIDDHDNIGIIRSYYQKILGLDKIGTLSNIQTIQIALRDLASVIRYMGDSKEKYIRINFNGT